MGREEKRGKREGQEGGVAEGGGWRRGGGGRGGGDQFALVPKFIICVVFKMWAVKDTNDGHSIA